MSTRIYEARFAELTVDDLYALLRLRVDVFVVEQACAYPDLDGRDVEPSTRHIWITDGDRPAAYARIIADASGARIGRVVTAAPHRRRGLAEKLIRHALATTAGAVVLDAQSPLVPWYRRFGFEAVGEEYVEDGIPHVPMRLLR